MHGEIYNRMSFFYSSECQSCLISVFAGVCRYILDDRVLEIINVSFGDQGFYVCVARTPVDQDMAVAQLSVVGELCDFSLCGLEE